MQFSTLYPRASLSLFWRPTKRRLGRTERPMKCVAIYRSVSPGFHCNKRHGGALEISHVRLEVERKMGEELGEDEAQSEIRCVGLHGPYSLINQAPRQTLLLLTHTLFLIGTVYCLIVQGIKRLRVKSQDAA